MASALRSLLLILCALLIAAGDLALGWNALTSSGVQTNPSPQAATSQQEPPSSPPESTAATERPPDTTSSADRNATADADASDDTSLSSSPSPSEDPSDSSVAPDQNDTADADPSERTSASDPPATSESPSRAPEKEPKEKEDEIYVVVEEKPDCGEAAESVQEYVENHPPETTWPWTATEGRVFVQFVVTNEGEVVHPKVTRGVSDPLNATAIRAVKSLECEPGINYGKRVHTQMSLPVTFRDE